MIDENVRGKLAVIALMLLVTSCASAGPPIKTIASECGELKEISYAYDRELCTADPENTCDSEETVKEIEAHNAYVRELCAE